MSVQVSGWTQPSQGLVACSLERRGSVDDQGVGCRRDFCESIHGATEFAIPCEGQVRGCLSQHVSTALEGGVCLVVQRVCHQEVSGQRATRIKVLPAHGPGRDLPEDILPRLEGRVDTGRCWFT